MAMGNGADVHAGGDHDYRRLGLWDAAIGIDRPPRVVAASDRICIVRGTI